MGPEGEGQTSTLSTLAGTTRLATMTDRLVEAAGEYH